MVTFDDLLACSARRIETIVNKNAPFGDTLLATVSSLPRMRIDFEQVPGSKKIIKQQHDCTAFFDVKVQMINWEQLKQQPGLPDGPADVTSGGCLGTGNKSSAMLILGDENDQLLFAQRLKYEPICIKLKKCVV